VIAIMAWGKTLAGNSFSKSIVRKLEQLGNGLSPVEIEWFNDEEVVILMSRLGMFNVMRFLR